jgi:hypothetical protein
VSKFQKSCFAVAVVATDIVAAAVNINVPLAVTIALAIAVDAVDILMLFSLKCSFCYCSYYNGCYSSCCC